MKTAISIPDALFDEAEQTAGDLKMSRSQLYVEAIREFLEKRSASRITKQLNAVYGKEPSRVAPKSEAALYEGLSRETW